MQKMFVMVAACCALIAAPLYAQVPVRASLEPSKLLASADLRQADNKRLVYDFWREVLEGGHLELAEKYLAVSYVQHNPSVPTGRAGFIDFFSKFAKPRAIEPTIKAPLVAVVAEGDYVVLSFVRELGEPADPAKKYTTTSFDMFRVENGKIAEHWDAEQK